ncbi:MAG: diguanylate cyclase [Candidatus Tyrphobacter sp.]
MPEASAFPPSFPAAKRIDVGELIRQVSEVLASEQPLAESVTELCTLLAHAFGARSVSILLDDPGRPCAEYRYDMPLGLVGESIEYAESVPLQIGQQSIGALTIAPRSRDSLASHDVSTLETCARYIAVGLRNARLAHTNDDLERLIEVDPLTEVGNRRRFDLRIDAEWRRCSRNQEPLSVVMIDVDYFKEFNDRYGHVAGDACLQRIAKALSGSTMRASDVVTRYGGEEFAVLLAETDLAGAVAVAENIRLAVERLQIPHAGTSIGTVSISAGVATVTPSPNEASAALVEAADLALYRAKSAGRNRIVAGAYVSEGSIVQRCGIQTATNLPIPLTTFLGRRNEIAQIERLLQNTRLLTLVGPGGVGKTRLALEVSASHAGARSVTFVDLAPAVCPAAVGPTILSALGLHDELTHSTEETICHHLERNGGLLAVDNCEHVLVECARLAELLLRTAHGVTIIATSREPLGVRGEATYRIPTLEIPPEGAPLTAQEALAYDAVHLFVDRAKLVDPAFELTNENANTVARICRRIDGIPLAIELAAPRLRMMTLEQIERGLDNRFTLLTNGQRNALPRQKTLYALIRWGYELLSPSEQRALQRLSVLIGNWGAEAAVAIAGDADLGADEVPDLVSALVDKSLLIVEPRGNEMRYYALESTRAFAAECLQASGEAAHAERAHARYFYDLIVRTMTADEREDAAAFKAIRGEYDNIQAALRWTLVARGDAELGVALVDALWEFWQGSGRYREAQRWLDHTLKLDIGEDRSRSVAARLAKATMNLGEAQQTLDRALPLIDRCAQASDGSGLHLARRMAASAYFELNDTPHAREQIQAMLAEPCVGPEERALSLGYLAYVEMHDGSVEEALSLLAEAVTLDVPPSIQSWIHEYYAIALFLSGRTEEAVEHAQACLAYEDSVHNGTRGALASLTLAWCWLAAGEFGRARIALRRCIRESTLTTRPDYLCACLDAFALLAAERGEPARGATILGFARAERSRRGVRAPFQRILSMVNEAQASMQQSVGTPAFESAITRGGWLSLEAATNEALAI